MKQTFINKELKESCAFYQHKSGVKIYVAEKPEYSSAYAIFGTRYGSIDTAFKRREQQEFITVPEGIAHFLEHKLFESEDGDAFSRYAKTGAMANAYTSFDRTCYLFSCSSNFEESFRILLDFVQNPYFTEATVQKEQGIIGQEINMYDDSAPWRLLFNLLNALYHNHPVKIDIAGTRESIAKINADLLYSCYNTFYNLNNMFICVAGNVKAEDVFKIADELLRNTEPVYIDRARVDEPEQIVKSKVEMNLPVATPMFAIGYKETCESPTRTIKERVCTDVILKVLFGSASPLYKKLFDAALINDSFSAEYFYGHGYSSIIVEGESQQPEKVYDIINQEIESVRKNGIDKNAFESAKKSLYGSCVSVYNSVENTVMSMVSAAFAEEGIFDYTEYVKDMTYEDVCCRFENILKKEFSAISVVKSK
ncbi:MAG: insulinase family protein [Clostridia bacterium]|nr:insulinase family protein [Clostridia bacterium]